MSSEQSLSAEDQKSQRLEMRRQNISLALSVLGSIGAFVAWLFVQFRQGELWIAIIIWVLGLIFVAGYIGVLIPAMWRNLRHDASWSGYLPYLAVLLLLVIILAGLAVPLFLPPQQTASSPGSTPTVVPTLTLQPNVTLTATVVGGATPTVTLPETATVTISETAPMSTGIDAPLFDIVALNTLDGDPNAYEVTDWLISEADRLASGNLAAEFPIQVTAHYSETEHYSDLTAMIDGDGVREPIYKSLGNVIESAAGSTVFTLTLRELVDASGIETNYPGDANLFADGSLRRDTAKLTIKVMASVGKSGVSEAQEIEVRNAPWEFSSEIVQRNGKPYLDSTLRNMGGSGLFAVMYHLRRVDNSVSSNPHPMYAGTEEIAQWSEPADFTEIESGAYYTTSVELPVKQVPGTYYVEAYPIKQQPSITVTSVDADWRNVFNYNQWWMSGWYRSTQEMFVYDPFAITNELISIEHKRLIDEIGVDLGWALAPASPIASPQGIVGIVQTFNAGEIVVYSDTVFSLYGPILRHYRQSVRLDESDILTGVIGLPLSPISVITSTGRTQIMKMTFENPSSPDAGQTTLYASQDSAAIVEGDILSAYIEHGGDAAWLGLPLADAEQYSTGAVQAFEGGYLTMYEHPAPDVSIDGKRLVVATRYPANSPPYGRTVDVDSAEGWQCTGITITQPARVRIVQVAGQWRDTPQALYYDANGTRSAVLDDLVSAAGLPLGALIAQVGSCATANDYLGPYVGDIRLVGRSAHFKNLQRGELLLMMNDKSVEDNDGIITVLVDVYTPSPWSPDAESVP